MTAAVFSTADASIVVALIAAMVTVWNARATKIAGRAAADAADAVDKQTKPNGGSSFRDVLDRTEARLALLETQGAERHAEVLARLDHGAVVMAEHADRLAVLEARPANARTRTTDKPKPRKATS